VTPNHPARHDRLNCGTAQPHIVARIIKLSISGSDCFSSFQSKLTKFRLDHELTSSVRLELGRTALCGLYLVWLA
jgi:hypothetical protein